MRAFSFWQLYDFMKSILLSLQGHEPGSRVSLQILAETTMLCAGPAVPYHQGALPGWALFPLLNEAEWEALGLELRLGGYGQGDRL